MPDSKIYKNPPLIETVFEVFFVPENWSSVIPGLFYTKINDKFPVISKVDLGLEFTLTNDGVRLDKGNNEITRYANENGDTLIQLAPHFLSVNKLPKYDSWVSYFDIITMAVEALVGTLQIKRIRNIGLKCINRIDIDNLDIQNLKKYLTIFPSIPEQLDNLESEPAFLLKYEKRYKDIDEILSISVFTSSKTNEQKAPIVIEFHRFNKKGLNIIAYKDWIEKAHIQLKESFDLCFTELAKEKFDE
jgi:uncharacterized protein (TIGR04255 family)